MYKCSDNFLSFETEDEVLCCKIDKFQFFHLPTSQFICWLAYLVLTNGSKMSWNWIFFFMMPTLINFKVEKILKGSLAFGENSNYGQESFSMTQLLSHTFAHLTGSSFRLKAKLLPIKNILGVKYNWVNSVKKWPSF